MEITDVRLRRVHTEGRMRAIASITMDHEFVVHDIRVIDGNNGLLSQCQASGRLTANLEILPILFPQNERKDPDCRYKRV